MEEHIKWFPNKEVDGDMGWNLQAKLSFLKKSQKKPTEVYGLKRT